MITLFALLLATTLFPQPVAGPSISAPASTQLNPCPLQSTDPKLVDPPNIESRNGELDLTLTLESELFHGGQRLCWVYASPEGGTRLLTIPPTLNVKQGERMVITLVNTLTIPLAGQQQPPPLQISADGSGGMAMGGDPANPYALMCGQPQVAPTPTQDPVTGRIYGYHRSPWNEANLHFHGLNTSPKAPGDDVTNVLLCPRPLTGRLPNIYHYVVDIPRDEPPGLYWYHPHAHGESQYQVNLGLTGAIVVHTAQPSIPDSLPNHLIITRDQPLTEDAVKYRLRAAFIGAHPSFTQIRAQLALGGPDFQRGPGGDPFQPPPGCLSNQRQVVTQTDALTVNGLPLPSNSNTLQGLSAAKIGLGETQYWRFANTAANTTLDVVLYVNGQQTPLLVTARDGVPLVMKNGHPTYAPVAMNDVFLMPASRFEFYLKGTTPGAKLVFRTRTVDTGCVGDNDLARDLFFVTVGRQQTLGRLVVPGATDPVPQRFADLGGQAPAKRRTFILTEYPRTDEPEPDFYITETSNPKAVEHPYRMTGPPDVVVKDGTVEEWRILNYTNEIHAFHIHQIHFMPIDGVDPSQGLGQLLDTVVVPYGGYVGNTFVPGGVKLLLDFRARDIIGTFVYHCHILEHEDAGMMARIQVVP